MIANVSPSSLSYFETLSTLKFAQRAKMIKNDAVINEDSSANVKQLKLEIQKLKLRISELEIEKASLKCQPSGNNPNILVSPISRHQSQCKADNPMKSRIPDDYAMHLDPDSYVIKNNKDEQFLSPSRFSCFGIDDFTSNSMFVKRIKELEDLLKLLTDNSLKAAKYYEAEMTDKDRSIKVLERQLEEYKIIQNKDEMLINFRDKTIQMLKSSINLNTSDIIDQQLKYQAEEIEALRYKLKSNPEFESLKERCSRVERENEQINGEDGKALETLFRGIVQLNESIQEYFTKYHSNTEQDIVANEKMKRMSDISDLYEKEKKDYEELMNKAQQEINSLKHRTEELARESNFYKEKNNILSEKEQSAQNRYEQIKKQLDEYRREMSNFADVNENEQHRLKLELINFQNSCGEYESQISLLSKQITNHKENSIAERKRFEEEKSTFDMIKQNLEKQIDKLSSKLKQVNDEVEYHMFEYNELEDQKQQLEQSLENISEENANLQNKLNEVENENLCLTARVSQLEDENDVLQQTHAWQTGELEGLQKKLDQLSKEATVQKSTIQNLKKDNKSLKDLSHKRHQDIQLKYSELSQQLNEAQCEYNKLQEVKSQLDETLAEKERVIERQSENIRDLVDQNTSLKDKVATLESDIKDMNEALNANNEEFREIRLTFEDTVSQVRQLSNELTVLQNEKRSNENKYESSIRRIQDEKEQTESKLIRTQKKVFEQENQLTSISRQLEMAKLNTENNISLKKEVEVKSTQLFKSEKKYQLTQNEIRMLSEVISQKDKEIQNLMNDKETLRIEISQKENDICELSTKLNSQSLEIGKITNEKYELEHSINELSGHSNSHQKIKYVSSLREKYNQLVSRNTELDKEIKKLLKVISENGLSNKLEANYERSLSSKDHSLIMTQIEEPKMTLENKTSSNMKFTQEVKENQNPLKARQKSKNNK